jgi:hypothetical protein
MPKDSRKIIVSSDELRQFLEKNCLSQTEAASMCSVTSRTFRRWIAGRPPMPKGMWELLQIKVREMPKS